MLPCALPCSFAPRVVVGFFALICVADLVCSALPRFALNSVVVLCFEQRADRVRSERMGPKGSKDPTRGDQASRADSTSNTT